MRLLGSLEWSNGQFLYNLLIALRVFFGAPTAAFSIGCAEEFGINKDWFNFNIALPKHRMAKLHLILLDERLLTFLQTSICYLVHWNTSNFRFSLDLFYIIRQSPFDKRKRPALKETRFLCLTCYVACCSFVFSKNLLLALNFLF